MSRHRKDDAYFYLIRVKDLDNKSIVDIAKRYKTSIYGDENEQIRQNIEFHSYLLAVAYIKAIELFVER